MLERASASEQRKTARILSGPLVILVGRDRIELSTNGLRVLYNQHVTINHNKLKQFIQLVTGCGMIALCCRLLPLFTCQCPASAPRDNVGRKSTYGVFLKSPFMGLFPGFSVSVKLRPLMGLFPAIHGVGFKMPLMGLFLKKPYAI